MDWATEMMIVMEFWKFFYQSFHFWFWCNSIIDLKLCIWGNLTFNYSRTKLYFIVIIELIFWIVWILIRRGWCFLAYLMETFFIFFGFWEIHQFFFFIITLLSYKLKNKYYDLSKSESYKFVQFRKKHKLEKFEIYISNSIHP